MDVTEGVAEQQQGDPEVPARSPSQKAILTLSPSTGRSIDERLAALSESIRQWDWRAGDVAPEPTQSSLPRAVPADLTDAPAPRQPVAPNRNIATAPAPAPAPATPALTGAGSSALPEPPTGPTAVVRNPIRLLPPDQEFDSASEELTNNVSAPRRRLFRRSRRPSSAPMAQAPSEVVPPTALPPTAVPQSAVPPTALPQSPARQVAPVELPSASEPDVVGGDARRTSDEPDQPAPGEPESTPTQTPWRYGKVILVVVTALIVVAIVAIIRSSAANPNPSDSLTPTSVTHTTSAPTPALIPVSSSVKSAFSAASVDLTAANAAVTRALAGGAAQSPAQVAQEVAPYVTALDTFNFKNHFLVWPAALQVPSQDLTLRTDELIHFLSSISSASPTTLTSWFAQFHSLARLTETTDNALRKDIGFPASNSYPT